MKENTKVCFHDLPDLSDYKNTWEFQEKLQKEIIDLKLSGIDNPAGHLIFCEHPHVYTLGRFGNEQNLLLDTLKLNSTGAQFFHIDRGGDITYHGPGQLVGYPIFNLEAMGLGVKSYIHKMEESIIEVLKQFNINAERLDGATGVWIDTDNPKKTRKICAMGVKVNRGVSMHGFALNVNTDLSYFNHINPCGFTDKSVTSIEKETGNEIYLYSVKEKLLQVMKKKFHFK